MTPVMKSTQKVNLLANLRKKEKWKQRIQRTFPKNKKKEMARNGHLNLQRNAMSKSNFGKSKKIRLKV